MLFSYKTDCCKLIFMDHSTIRIGVMGCGKRLQSILQHLLKTVEHDKLEVVAFYDAHPSAATALRDELAPGAEVVADEAALLGRQDIDWVLIGSWNCFHANQAIAALEAGKHVFCEKPLATEIDDCVRLQRARAAHPDQFFFFGLVLRYTTFYQKVKEVMDSGVLGQLISFEFNETLGFNHGGYIHGNWRRHRQYAGTHLLEKCCHDFDLANWLIGSLPVRAASFGGKDFFVPKNREFADSLGHNGNGKAAYQTWPDPSPVDPFSAGATIVDNQVAILQYANGVRATFHTNCNAALPERRFYLLGAKAALRADAVGGAIEVAKIGFDAKPEMLMRPGSKDAGHYGGDALMAERLASSMIHGTPPLADIEDGVRSAVSCLGVDVALDSGEVVDYSPLWDKVELRVEG